MKKKAQVAIIMGSLTDYKIMKKAEEALKEFNILFMTHIVSAHRTPEEMVEFAKKAHTKGIKIIIAGAGGAAHLPGMVASLTPLPVIGVPVTVNTLNGLDALLSIVQMPIGVPVATVSIDGAYNAGLLAARILSTDIEKILKKTLAFQKKQKNKVKMMNQKIK
jgi:5-(carboxyamino)imidazole ribonucleotide mutase